MTIVKSLRIQILSIQLLCPLQFVGLAAQLAPLTIREWCSPRLYYISSQRGVRIAELQFWTAISPKLPTHVVLVSHGLNRSHAHP